MAETTRLKLPLLEAAQAQKHVTHNEAVLLLDLLSGVITVASRALSAPPGGAVPDGTIHVLAGAGSGAWAGYGANDLACRVDGGWRRVLPVAGMLLTDAASADQLYRYSGAAWVLYLPAAARLGVLGGFRNKIVNPRLSINQREVAGTVILAAGVHGHDRFKAGSGGCTYTFSAASGITTLSISAGTLQQVVLAGAIDAGPHILTWDGTAQGRIGAGAYGASGAVGATLTGGTDVTVEWGTGTLSKPMLEWGAAGTFASRHPRDELALCTHHFRRLRQPPLIGIAASSSNAARMAMTLDPPMYASPSLSMGGGTLSVWNGVNVLSVTGLGGNYGAAHCVEIDMTVSPASLVASNPVKLLNAFGTAYLDLSADP